MERAGIVFLVYGLSAIGAAPLAGTLSDRLGSRRVMLFSLLASGAVFLVYPFVSSFAGVVVLTAVLSLVSEVFRPASLAVVSALVSPEKRKPAFALQRLAINLGMSVGPAVGGFLAQSSFRSLFFVDGVTALLAGLVLLFSPWRIVEGAAEPGEGDAPSAAPWRDLRFLLFLVGVFPVAAAFFQFESTMPLYLVRDLHLEESTYGLLFTVNTLLIVFLEVPLNTWMAEVPHRISLVVGSLLCGAGFGLLLFVKSVFGVALMSVVWTFGEMTLLPSFAAFVSDTSPPERRGSYIGFYTMVFNVAFGVGPALGTAVYGRFGPAVLWIATLGCSVLSAAIFALLKPRGA